MKTKLSYLFLPAAILIASAMWSCKSDPVSGDTGGGLFIDVDVKFTGKSKPSAGNKLYVWLYYDSQKAAAAGSADAWMEQTLTADDIANGVRVTLEDVNSGSKYILAWTDSNGNGTLEDGDFAAYYNNVIFDDVKDGSKTPADVGSSYLVSISLSLKVGAVPTGSVTDIDGNKYNPTERIGSQIWLKENLRVTKFRDGTAIQTGFSDAAWIATLDRTDGTGTPGYSQHPSADFYTEGLLYNWFAASSPKGLCPEGWRTPTELDWQILEAFLGMSPEEIDRSTAFTGNVGNKLKAVGYGDGTDDYGFGATPTGQRDKDTGNYLNPNGIDRFETDAYYWASTDASDMGTNGFLQGYRRVFRDTEPGISRYNVHKAAGCAVRCIKDEEVKLSFTVTTTFSADEDYLPQAGAELNTYLFYSDPSGKPFAELTADKSDKTTLTAADIENGASVMFENIDSDKTTLYAASWVDSNADGEINDGDFVSFYNGISFADVEEGAVPTNAAGSVGVVVDHKMPLGIVIERGTVTDHENNEYATVKIGTQIWMSENLRVSTFRDGSEILFVDVTTKENEADWIGLIVQNEAEWDAEPTPGAGTGTPAYGKNPRFFTETVDTPKVGYTYNWHVVNDDRGVCPTGWHVPSDPEWKVLEAYIGVPSDELDKLAAWRGTVGATLWCTEEGGSDMYGFNLVVCGGRNNASPGAYTGDTADAAIWTSSDQYDLVKPDPETATDTEKTNYKNSYIRAHQRLFRKTHAGIHRRVNNRVYGAAIRCVKDAE